jgi:hypothetical protein
MFIMSNLTYLKSMSYSINNIYQNINIINYFSKEKKINFISYIIYLINIIYIINYIIFNIVYFSITTNSFSSFAFGLSYYGTKISFWLEICKFL